MEQATRKIIYWEPSCVSNTILTKSIGSSWDIDIVHDEENAIDLLSRNKYSVGIAHMGDYGDPHDHHLENILSNSHTTEWVALVAKNDFLEKQEYRDTILSSFYDYHTLPANSEKLLTTIGHAYGIAKLREKSGYLPGYSGKDETEMVGTSKEMKALFVKIRKVSTVDAPVLINGESGTGKELAAMAVHERSSRKDGPFIAVNCGALPGNLIQSELFGYEKGAFTGANHRKIGKIEAATGGTIFLDEIGDLPLDQQTNLLRFLQDKSIDRIGGTKSQYVDVRVIAATHVDIEKAVREGNFREDLYYRLNVLSLEIPSLRDREGDIEILAKYMFKKFSDEKNHYVNGFSQEALRIMSEYHWPGNVREMINKIRRAMLMCDGKLIKSADLGLNNSTSLRNILTLDEVRKSAEVEAIMSGLRHTRNNITHAAKKLGVSRVTLYRLMEKHSINT